MITLIKYKIESITGGQRLTVTLKDDVSLDIFSGIIETTGNRATFEFIQIIATLESFNRGETRDTSVRREVLP